MTIRIESNVPMPDDIRLKPQQPVRGVGVYPWAQLEVGDSFECNEAWMQSLRAGAYSWAHRNAPGRRFVVRRVGGGKCRIWRVE